MAYKFSKETVDKIADFISKGHPKGIAVLKSGIKSRQTFHNWERGVGLSEEEHLYILDTLKEAEERREDALLQVIYEAGRSGKWQAAAWLLERLYGDKYRVTSKVEAKVDSTERIRQLAFSDKRVADTIVNGLLVYLRHVKEEESTENVE